MSKHHVLFVDDEPRILDGLRRSLRIKRRDWEMRFQSSGKEALEVMAAEQFDVVVSDMMMPGMDGPDFLAEVSRLHPRTIRIILSGHADKSAILRTVGTAHQFVTKPCDGDALTNVVQRSLALRQVLENEQLQNIVGQTTSLPSMPALYQQLTVKAQDPKTSLPELAQIISQDVGMTAKLLKLVNSAFFGTSDPVTSVERAVICLGLETMLALVLSAQIFDCFVGINMKGWSLESFTTHSLLTAQIARGIARTEGVPDLLVDEAFLGGLLHEVGKLILCVALPERYAEIVEHAKDSNLRECDAERAILGTTHGHVGAYLLGLWGLPDRVLEAVAYHERPSECCARGFTSLAAVHAANALVHYPRAQDPSEAGEVLDADYLSEQGLLDRWPAWQQAAVEATANGVAQ